MTYLQLMMKIFEVFIKENPGEDYHEYWRNFNETIEEFRKGLKLGLIYLLLTKINNNTQVDTNLLKKVEGQLTGYDVSFSKTMDVVKGITDEEILQDPYSIDLMCLMQNAEIDEELKQELANDIANEYIEEFGQNFKDNIQQVVVSKPIDNIIYDIITLLPELFFTIKGYSYISDEYKIDDEELREKLYYYVRNTICSYRNLRIDDYGREKFGIPMDEVDETLNEEDEYDEYEFDEDGETFNDIEEYDDGYGVEEWVIDTQFTGYSGLYHSIKLISIILGFVKNKQYDKLNKFISIDEYIKSESKKIQGEGDQYTLVEILYDTRNISEFELTDDAFGLCENDKYLDFFLGDSVLSSSLTNEQIGRLILYYFDAKDSNSINEIKNNLETLEMRRILRPTEKFAYDWELICESRYFFHMFHRDDAKDVLLNGDVMYEERIVKTVVFDDDDDSYVPDCILFDYYVCDCKENLKLTSLEEWKRFYEADKPIIFINTSYMFSQFEMMSDDSKLNSGAYLWVKFFIENYKKNFWLRDRAKFVFIVSRENSNKILEYQCNGLIGELRPVYLLKNKDNVRSKEAMFVKKKIPPKQSDNR